MTSHAWPRKALLAGLTLLFWGNSLIGSRAALRVPPPTSPRIYLLSETLAPPSLGADPAKALSFLKPGPQVAILQFSGPVQSDWKDRVEKAGVHPLHYLPDFAFAARGTDAAFQTAARLPFVRWIGPYRPEYRLSPSLPRSGETDALADLEADADASAFVDAAARTGLAATVAGPRLIRLRGPAEAIRSLASDDSVRWICPPMRVTLMNDRSRALLGVNAVWNDLGLYGDGQILGIADTGLDTGNMTTLAPDFKGRILKGIALDETAGWYDQHGHGTHVAGAMVGQGNPAADPPDPNSLAGVAPRAQLVVQGYQYGSDGIARGFPDDLNSLFQQAYDAGVRVHNDSWGDGGAPYGAYSMNSGVVDDFIWKHPDMTLVFAAGNDGTDSPARGVSPDETYRIKSTTGLPAGNGIVQQDSLYAPATAKNCLTVGASEGDRPRGQGWGGFADYTWGSFDYKAFKTPPLSTDYVSDHPEGMAPFSSRGPTKDGRIKPDIASPGTDIVSVRSQWATNAMWGPYNKVSGYWYNGGTSIAAGFISGSAALIRQWYQDRQGVTPSAALVKATMLNGARELSPGQYGTGAFQEIPPRPNVVEGWGRADVGMAVDPPAPLAVRYADEKTGIQTGDRRSWLLKVRQSGHPLRIMTVWTDYPGTPDALFSLVNDLDLTVAAPSGDALLGNGVQDRANNVEAVDLDSADAGVYRITIAGYNVPDGPQPFALTTLGDAVSLAVPGDLDGDGRVTVRDATKALQAAVGLIALTDDQLLAGNVNDKGASAGRVDIQDVTGVLQAAVGLESL
jgi:hypothetical protein